MEMHEMIISRHSVRDFSEQPVEKEKLDIIIEAGRSAPSAQNRQCWRYIIMRKQDNIRKFAKNIGLVGTVNHFIGKAPLVIIACAIPGKSVRMNSQEYYLVDTAISFQQMMLVAWSLGIGSCWLAAFNEDKVKKHLQIPAKVRIVGMSPFGYPKDKKSLYSQAVKVFANSEKRLGREKIISYENWKF